MRFCLVSTQQHWGGGESLLLSIAQELQQHGHAIGWVVRDASLVQQRVEEAQQLILHGLRKRGNNWRDWTATIHLLRSWVPDVLLLNDTHAVPLGGAASWFCRQPRPLRLAYKHTIFPLRSKLKYNLLSDQLICVSRAARATLLDGGMPAERCHVIYGGCPEPSVDRGKAVDLRQRLGLKAGEKMLVSVGSLLDCKGHADLLAAMPAVKQQFPSVRLFIAGDGDQRDRLQSQRVELGLEQNVTLLGYRQDVETLISAADLVVHPSHAEGLSLVLIQAQLLERPIVATAVGGAAEVLQSDAPEQCSAWIARPREPASLSETMVQALTAIDGDTGELQERLTKTAARTGEQFNLRRNALLLVDHCARWLAQGDKKSLKSVR